MTPPRALQAAFRAAEYRVLATQPFTVHAGQPSAGLRRWMRRHQASHAVMLTACNPAGARRSAAQNRAAQARLRSKLTRINPKALLPGLNLDPRGVWPPEPSFWVLGPPPAVLAGLARAHGQGAILVCGPRARPRLRWL